MPDAVVVGAGHNGLVAANLLADEGWDVLVLEAQDEPGGAVRSAELTAPGVVHDLFSAFYPLAVASPVMRGLDLEQHGLRWLHAPLVLAHPTPDGPCAVISRDIDVTAASVERFARGDGEAWRQMFELWQRAGDAVLDTLFSGFPPVAPAARLAARLGAGGLVRFARQVVLPVRRFGAEEFAGAGGPLLLAGNTMHTDLSPEAAAGAAFGWLLACLAQDHGFPLPEGGAARLVDALVARLSAGGGQIRCRSRVERILIREGRAVGVVTADGTEIDAERAVLADVDALTLYRDLVGEDHLPPRVVSDLRRFQYDLATVKVDWLIDGKVPWTAEEAGGAGTVHLAASMDQLTWYHAELATGRLPSEPFLVVGQMTTADPSRSPEGTEVLWAYTHVPHRIVGDAAGEIDGPWDGSHLEAFADRMQGVIERYAPGFGDRVRQRVVLGPRALEARDESLVGGSMNGGTSQIHQQLVFRPLPGLGRPATPVRDLYLASSSAHPGGGVHGGPGANAARAALGRHRLRRLLPLAGAGVAVAAAGAGVGVARRRS